MKLKYITKIKANSLIYTNKKTSNLLSGTYNSIFKGKSSNFEDLREYVIGDNIKDIDWKASARSNITLVRQYIAEKKHNIMLVLDTGKKMLADTENNNKKSEIATITAGTIAYIASQNGDYIGAMYNKEKMLQYFPFKLGLYNIEKILTNYEKDIKSTTDTYLEQSLKYIIKNINRHMIIFVITDLDGIENMQEATLRTLTAKHDVLFININDACMTGEIVYDIENSSYIPNILLKDKKLHEIEKKIKDEMYEKNENKLKKYSIQVETINSNKEIITKIIKLLERHKHANIS